MVAIEKANVSWLSNMATVARLELYTTHPELLRTVPVKQAFWRDRKILTLHDAINTNAMLQLLDGEVVEVQEAKEALHDDPTNMEKKMSVRKETADVVVFAKTFATFANGTWEHGRGRVLEAVDYAKKTNASVGGDLAEDVIKVVSGKNGDNYSRLHYDWGWMLSGLTQINDESVNKIYCTAKTLTRSLRDEQGDDGVLPHWLGAAMICAIKSRDESQMRKWLRDPLVSKSLEVMLQIRDVVLSEITK